MNKKTIGYGAVTLALAMLIAGAQSTSAFFGGLLSEENHTQLQKLHEGGDREVVQEFKEKLKEEYSELRESVEEAIEEGNFDEFHNLTKDTRLGDRVDEEKFEKLQERHAQKTAVKEAIENGDYDVFVELTADRPFGDEISEADFERLQEAHELREAEDREGAREIMKDLGIGGHHGKYRSVKEKQPIQ